MTIFIGGDNSDFLKKWESTKRALRKGLGSEAMALSESIATGFAAAAVAMGALGLASVKMAGEMQANKRAFATLLGDSQQAEKFLGELARFAAETPFELPGLVTASKKLLAYGFAARDIIPMMAAIGRSGSPGMEIPRRRHRQGYPYSHETGGSRCDKQHHRNQRAAKRDAKPF